MLAVYALGVVLMLATGWFVAREVFGKKPITAPGHNPEADESESEPSS